jgi:hypothetical protein
MPRGFGSVDVLRIGRLRAYGASAYTVDNANLLNWAISNGTLYMHIYQISKLKTGEIQTRYVLYCIKDPTLLVTDNSEHISDTAGLRQEYLYLCSQIPVYILDLAERCAANIGSRELDRERMVDPFENNQSKAAGAAIPSSHACETVLSRPVQQSRKNSRKNIMLDQARVWVM